MNVSRMIDEGERGSHRCHTALQKVLSTRNKPQTDESFSEQRLAHVEYSYYFLGQHDRAELHRFSSTLERVDAERLLKSRGGAALRTAAIHPCHSKVKVVLGNRIRKPLSMVECLRLQAVSLANYPRLCQASNLPSFRGPISN